MDKKYRVLFLQTNITATDGASVALKGFIKDNDRIISYKVLSLYNDGNTGLNVRTVTSWHDVKTEIDSGEYDIIHYFKTIGYVLFKWTYKALKYSKLRLPVYTTVNQSPSYKGLLLSPKEINSSEVIVFIDATAFNDKILYFIPKKRKRIIYYSTSDGKDLLNELYIKRSERLKASRESSHVVFGRGSTLIKCPEDMYDIFHKIEYRDKEFRVIGIPLNSNIAIEGKKYSDVSIWPTLPLDEWYNQLSQFDVFLYQIPELAYSSLDGTIGAAMILGIPVVYYGPEAPKERFVQGVNGYVAANKNEIPVYCQKLAEDPELRKRIGEEGRKSTLETFSWRNTVREYIKVWDLRYKERIIVPLHYKYMFYRLSLIVLLKDWLLHTIVGRFYIKIIR